MNLFCYTLSQTNGVIKTAVDVFTEYAIIDLAEIMKTADYLRSLVAGTSFTVKAENAVSVWAREGLRGTQQVVRLAIEVEGVDLETASAQLHAAGFRVFR